MKKFELIGKYGLLGLISTLIDWILTKIFFPKARLIRFPFVCRHKISINLGRNLTTGRNCRIEATSSAAIKKIMLGDNIELNDNVHITGKGSVIVGNNVLIASKVYISDCCHGGYGGDYHSEPETIPKVRDLTQKNVVIEDNVWLGENVCVLPGSHIGFGSIIGANSTVIGFIPKNCIAVGSPAKVIKAYNPKLKQWAKIR